MNLRINLAIAQIIFVAGVNKIHEISVPIQCQVIPPPLLLPGLLHVDADGGCGPICGSCASLCEAQATLHIGIHSD